MRTLGIDDLTVLGDGPIATVYSGLHRGVPVALKVFPRRLDKPTMAVFVREQSTLAGLRRVAPILPADGVEELATGEWAVRMELCPRSLARLAPMNAVDVLATGRAVALALAAAHRAGIAHGGVSPHNVLFRASDEPVVSDFGVGLRRTLGRDPLSAVDYLPPETLLTGLLDERTDLYGLGAVLYFALAGRPPYPGRLGERLDQRVKRILGTPPPAVTGGAVPVALSTLVARLLAPNPANRPSGAAQIANELGDLLPHRPPDPEADGFDDFATLGQASGQPPGALPPPAPTRADPGTRGLYEFDDFAAG